MIPIRAPEGRTIGPCVAETGDPPATCGVGAADDAVGVEAGTTQVTPSTASNTR